MATLEKRLEDHAYKRWIKAGICLAFVKKGLEQFVDQRSQIFHQNVLGQLRSNGNPSCNGICAQTTVWKGKISCCNNCQAFVDEIVKQNFKSFKFQQGNWDNSIVQLWPKDPWELAKVFMNPGQKASQRSPADTDLSGVLNFIDHCVTARRDIRNVQNIAKVRDSRNKLMHSSTMSLSQQELDGHIDAMIALLQDPGSLGMMNSAQDVVKEICKVKDADFCITKECEFKVLTEKTEILQLKIALMNKEIKRLGTQTETIQAETKRNDFSMTQLQADTERNMNVFKDQLHKMEIDEKEVKHSIEVLKKTLSEDEYFREAFGSRMEKLDISLEGVRLKMETLTQEIGIINQRLITLEATLAEQKLHGRVLMARQDAIEKREDTLEEELQKWQMSHCSVSGPADFSEGYNDLQKCLIEEYKRLGFHISLSPIYECLIDETLKVHLDEVYTDLKILHAHKKEESILYSYKDLFKSDEIQNRNIIVTGEAGIGKSTWCIKLVQAWTKAHEKSVINPNNKHVNPRKDTSRVRGIVDLEEALSAFDFLFFVQLRYIEEVCSIKEMIFSSIERLSKFKATVQHIIERYSEKVLIILDGLDEYSLNPSYAGLNFCTVISTTRPWKFDHISSRSAKFDMTLKISGLDENGITELSEKLFKVLKNQLSATAYAKPELNATQPCVDHFMENIKRNGMTDSIRTPLILIIMLETYLERGYLSSSRTCNMLSLVECLVIRGEQKLSDEEETKLEKMKECWSKSEKPFKGFDRNDSLSEYSGLLQKLTNLAYDGINRNNQNFSLVFNEKDLYHYFSQDELQLCLRFGLLSKSKQFTSFLTRMKVSISFYHKLLQEWFASLWIVNSTESFLHFKSSINSIQGVIEMENMIYFIYGTDAHLGSDLTKHLVDLFNRDPIILGQRQNIHSDIMLPWELHQMSSIFLQCQEEVCSTDQSYEPVYTSDISVFSLTNSHSMDSVLELMRQSKHCLKSLFVQCIPFEHVQWLELLELINESVAIETLVIILPTFPTTTDSRISLQQLTLDFSQYKNFKNCYLVGRGPSTVSGLLPMVIGIESALNLVVLQLRNIGSECCSVFSNVILELKNLEYLSMDNMDFTEGDLLLQNTKLQTLYMRNVALNNSSVVLSKVYELRDVIIKFTEMQRAGWEDLFYELNYQPKLVKLVIQNVNCVGGTLNLEQSTCLEYLRLHDFSVSDIRIAPCKQLKVLDLRKIYLPSSPDYPESCTSASELTYWQAALTADMEDSASCFQEKRNTSDADNIMYITEDKTERECDLAGIQESSFFYSDWGRILGSLPTDSLEEIVLFDLHIGNANIALENSQHLKLISLYQLTMSEESFIMLFSVIANLRSLPALDIKALNVSGKMRDITIRDFQNRSIESMDNHQKGNCK